MGTPSSAAAVRRRYGWVASIYDWANLEGMLYAPARARAIELLDLEPGARVLDVACGTGANFTIIEEHIGPAGRLVGVDLTAEMLDRARARVARSGWTNVDLVQADVSTALVALGDDEPFDAAVCTLALSVIPQWEDAWDAMRTAVRPGGRVAVMDAGHPERPRQAAYARPFAWTLSQLFAADCRRRPWRLLQRDAGDVTTERFTLGWVTAAAGTTRAR